jgi:hypothetical protein
MIARREFPSVRPNRWIPGPRRRILARIAIPLGT